MVWNISGVIAVCDRWTEEEEQLQYLVFKINFMPINVFEQCIEPFTERSCSSQADTSITHTPVQYCKVTSHNRQNKLVWPSWFFKLIYYWKINFNCTISSKGRKNSKFILNYNYKLCSVQSCLCSVQSYPGFPPSLVYRENSLIFDYFLK